MSKSFKKAQRVLWPTDNVRIEKVINYIMKDGKRSVAKKIYSDMLNEIKLHGHMNPVIVVETAIENASPNMMIKSKRLGGSVYQVPVEVKVNKRLFYAMKWILNVTRAKKGMPMYKKLAEEMLAAYSNQWAAVKKKEEIHKMADANKAFAYMAKYVN